jgi:pimeloyl-ACP methyl ester carboxylesterase
MPLIQVAGHRLEYEWIGQRATDRPTLVFLHEGLGSVGLWRDFPAALCRRMRCSGLVYSRWGHGASDPLDGPRTVRFMHEEGLVVLPALLDAFSIRRPLLIGHSDGGSIALIYEGSRIGESAGLILEAPHVFVEEPTWCPGADLAPPGSRRRVRDREAGRSNREHSWSAVRNHHAARVRTYSTRGPTQYC